MEPNYLFPSTWILVPSTFLLFSIVLVSRQQKEEKKKKSYKLPPGPSKLPVIGSLHHFVGDLPHRRLHDLSTTHGPLMHIQLGQKSTIIVSSSAMAREFTSTRDIQFASKIKLFASRTLVYGCTDIFFSHYGDYWKKLRHICHVELLSPMRVRTFTVVREEEVANMIKSISNLSSKPGTPVDLSEVFFSLSNNILCRAAFGEKCRQKERLLGYIKEGLKLIAGFNYFDVFPSLQFTTLVTGMKWRLVRLHKKIDAILNEIISDHMKEKKKLHGSSGAVEGDEEETLLDVLLRLHANKDGDFSFTLDNVKAVILDMFTGGTDTAATILEWTMTELIRSPDAMRKAQSEVRNMVIGSSKSKVDETSISQLKYMNLVIKENFRLHPPVPLLLRECRESCKVDGYDIPIKTMVLLNVYSIGRDPKHWKNPCRFEPERFMESSINYKGTSFELIPFGAGRRICPGISFGMSIVELALAELLHRFDWELPNGVSMEEFDIAESFQGTLGRKNHLVLVATPIKI